ncbi:MAG: hypothetical protein WBD40_01525 [Tepidisphaeraceae bacterium]
MGLFLAMSGLKGVSRARLEESLAAYARDNGMSFSPTSADPSNVDVLTIRSERLAHTVLYPGHFMEWDAVSAFLSIALRTTVVSMHIHDGDLWMYVLYVDGKVVDRFNPDPEYWGELSDEERESWSGNAELFASHWDGLHAADVSRYVPRGIRTIRIRRRRIRTTSFPWEVTGRSSTS